MVSLVPPVDPLREKEPKEPVRPYVEPGEQHEWRPPVKVRPVPQPLPRRQVPELGVEPHEEEQPPSEEFLPSVDEYRKEEPV